MKNKSIKWGKNVKLAAYMNSIFILAKRKKQDLGLGDSRFGFVKKVRKHTLHAVF